MYTYSLVFMSVHVFKQNRNVLVPSPGSSQGLTGVKIKYWTLIGGLFRFSKVGSGFRLGQEQLMWTCEVLQDTVLHVILIH